MMCVAYKKAYPRFAKLPLPRKVWDTPEFDEWMAHFHSCRSCSDWSLERRLLRRGVDPKAFPCVHVAYHSSSDCGKHGDGCPDKAISRLEKFDEYTMAGYSIRHCPWCGRKLPPSRRGEWFRRLEKMGITDPDDKRIPKTFHTDAWFRTRRR